jgi:two-component system, chemotaxis family, chemotaxis protein CheY
MWGAMPKGLVLLVEDDEDIREAVADVLVEAGYRVTQTGDGHQALETLRAATEHPRLAVVDMFMPVMGGVELVAQLRGAYPTLPVVMLSGAPRNDTQIDGVSATVQKPVTRDALLAVVALALSEPRIAD